MREKKQKRNNQTWLWLIVLLVALSPVIMTRIAVSGGDGGMATTTTPTPGDSLVIDPKAVATIGNALLLTNTQHSTAKLKPLAPVARYAAVEMTEDERRELAAIVYLEAGNQCAEGQQAVVEVVLNRVISESFPDNVHDVLHQGEGSTVPQFSTIYNIALGEPGRAQQDAISAALYSPSILPDDVVFFSRSGENDRVWGTIGDHVFCYAYIWE